MKLFDLLMIQAPEIKPDVTKVHLAVRSGEDNPLDLYLADTFDEWQSWQTKKNFERKYIVSLVQLPGSDRWMIVGGYESKGSEYVAEQECYIYKTEAISSLESLAGRLIVTFKRSGRQSYLNAENWAGSMLIEALLPNKMVVADFQGYNQSLVSKSKLDIIVQQNLESWHSALSNVSGVYLITDTGTGMLYVGSATGEEGIWQRWCQYSRNGHGGNKELMAILKEKGSDYSTNFQYSILEIADTHTSAEAVLERESYWKKVLCCREYGYNAN